MKKRKPRAKAPSKGLGDTIEKITTATGIKKAVEIFSEVTGIDCKCDERKEKLNKALPYASCFTKEQYEDWVKASKEIEETDSISEENQTKVLHYQKEVLNYEIHEGCTSCNASLWRQYVEELDMLADTYK